MRRDCSIDDFVRGESEDGDGDMSRYTPPVASHACCRKPVEPASWRTSMRMWRLWAAKMAFMMGMYWVEVSGDTDTIRTRETRRGMELAVASAWVVLVIVGSREVSEAGAARMVCLLMYARAEVRAPAIWVERASVVVWRRRDCRL